jgi:hypothetical protein
MFVTYMLQYLDKIALGYAAVMGVQADTVSHPERFISRLTPPSTFTSSNTLGVAAPFTLDTLLPASLVPSALSSSLSANTSRLPSSAGP